LKDLLGEKEALMEIVSVESLTKKYGKKVALNNVSLKVFEGEIVGLLGPNGAGKTTLIKCLTGLLKPNGGNIKLFGYDLDKNYGVVVKNVGLLLDFEMYNYLTAYENLRLLMIAQGIFNKEKIKEVLQFLDLWEVRDKSVSTFSFGMKQRLRLAQALVGDPQLLILDEPTVGLDPVGIKDLKDKLVYLSKNKGVTVFFSSHQLPDVEEICDRVILLKEGVILFDGKMDDIRGEKECRITVSKIPDTKIIENAILKSKPILQNNVLIVEEEDLNSVLKILSQNGIDIVNIDIKKGNLLDLFYTNGGKEQ
jgi:ABC-2 type transport system ATP-binding protein